MENDQMPDQVPMEPHEQVQPIAAEVTKSAVHMSLSVWIIGGLATVVFAGMVLGLSLKKDTNDQVGVLVTASPSPTETDSTVSPSPSPSPTSTTKVVSDAGVTWLSTPKVLADLKLIKTSTEFPDAATYYQVGTDNGKDIIAVIVPPDGPSNGPLGYLLKQSDTAYELIVASSPDFQNEDGTANTDMITATNFASAVTVNKTKVYTSIAHKKTLIYKGQTLTVGYSLGTNYFVSELKKAGGLTLTKLADLADGTLYQADEEPADGTTGRAYILQHQNDTYDSYRGTINFVSDDSVPAVTWTDGTKNTYQYRHDQLTKCGSSLYDSVLTNETLADLVKIGTTSKGEAVYGFKSSADPVVKAHYAMLIDGKYYNTDKNDTIAISLEDYFKANAVFVYPDPQGNLVVFTSSYYGSGAECGKPVVYLYPTKETQVSVKVGANVTKSEPTYGTGWNVTAQPNGHLMVDGKAYTSLFWEGTGKGMYPMLGNVGTVVAQADLVSTMKTQLTQLGLNTQESADFMAFWQPRMPKTPYVRLSWLGTQDMNRLAPLSISPKPDTLIRIFLDFEGMQSSPSISYAPQRLTTVPRKGFTVVEWGGLLVK